MNEEVSGNGEEDSGTYRFWEQKCEEAKLTLKEMGKCIT